MGAVVSAVGGAIGGAFEFVGNIDKQIVHAVEGAAKSVGKALESVGKTVKNDPIGTLAKVAAVVTQQYWALPLISAATVVAHGGSLMDAAIAGGVSYIGGEIAGGLSDYLQAGDMGLSAGAANAIGGGAANAATTFARTGDLEKSLTSGLISGAAGYAGGELSGELKDLGLNNTAANMISKIGVGTALGAATGKDAGQAFEGALASTLYKSVMDQGTSVLKGAWNSVNSTISEYNKQLEDTKSLVQNELTPAQQEATAAQEQAKSSYDDYQNKSEKFDDLVAKYDAAKAAGDTKAANDYADQANALIPELNAATDKFNADSTTYDKAMEKFDSINAKYEEKIAALDETKTSYETQNADLVAQAKELADASKEVSGMSEEAQKAFTNATGTGSDIKTALETSNKLNEMSDVAQATFNREFASDKSIDAALQKAEQINSLNESQASAFKAGVENELGYDEALTVASNAYNYNSAGQEAYAQALKSGVSDQDANMMALMAQLTNPDATPAADTAAAGTPIEGVYHKDPNTGMWSVVGKDAEGKDITLVPLAQGAGAPLVEGASAGQYNVSTDPNMPAQEVSNAPTLISELNDPKTGNITQILSDGTTKVMDSEGNLINAQNSAEGDAGTDTEPQPGATTAESGEPTTTAAKPTTGGPSLSSIFGNTTSGSTSAPKAAANISSPLTWSNVLSKWVPAATAAAAAATASSPVSGVTPTATTAAPTTTAPAATDTTANNSRNIVDLTPGLTKGSQFEFANTPTFESPLTNVQQQTSTPDYASQILAAAHGGHIQSYAEGQSVQTPDSPSPTLRPTLTRGSQFRPWGKFAAAQMGGYSPQKFAAGGDVPQGHNPSFFSQGGLNSLENTYVKGEGDGTSDSVAAMLANGEFVIPADVVSDLGNGSNDAGASVLDEFLKTIREHKRASDSKNLPPDSKGALAYLLDAKRKVS